MRSSASSTEEALDFRSPQDFLSDVDVTTMAHLIASGVDIALLIEDGVIKDIALSNGELVAAGYQDSWLGTEWVNTVTIESRKKVADLLKANPLERGRWRQVNHPSASGTDLPITYTTIRVGRRDRILALGRDLRSIAQLQQRLVKTHQELEREYTRLRETETRYLELFNTMSEPVLIVDAASYQVREANAAASVAFAVSNAELIARDFGELFAKESVRAAERVLASALGGAPSIATGIKIKDRGDWRLEATAFRQNNSAHLIVRLQTENGAVPMRAGAVRRDRALLDVVDSLPDALVVTAADLRIIAVNPAFSQMLNAAHDNQIVGKLVSGWLGRSTTEINMLTSNLKNYGVVRNFSTIVRDIYGVEEDVEVSAVAAEEAGVPCFGFAIRNTARRLKSGADLGASLPYSVEQVTGLVGRLPLKEIVRESSDIIEKLCVEAALEISDDNRASAAEILGLSRQGLYSKLKRFGFDDS